MLPTFTSGTISRNTQSPGHPGHFSTATLPVVVGSAAIVGSESLAGFRVVDWLYSAAVDNGSDPVAVGSGSCLEPFAVAVVAIKANNRAS